MINILKTDVDPVLLPIREVNIGEHLPTNSKTELSQ